MLVRRLCPRCKSPLLDEDKGPYCTRCRAAIGDLEIDPEEELPQRRISKKERHAILQEEIEYYLERDYRVVSQTDTTAQLVKSKVFSLLWALLWFLFFGVGLVVYLLYYVAKRDHQIYLSVDEYGKISQL